jgi:hypothetical protein
MASAYCSSHSPETRSVPQFLGECSRKEFQLSNASKCSRFQDTHQAADLAIANGQKTTLVRQEISKE